MSLKLDLCNFSGYKIYPSCGIRLARTDGKIYNFVNKKSRNAYLMKKNPRKIAWTVLYRYFILLPITLDEHFHWIQLYNSLYGYSYCEHLFFKWIFITIEQKYFVSFSDRD